MEKCIRIDEFNKLGMLILLSVGVWDRIMYWIALWAELFPDPTILTTSTIYIFGGFVTYCGYQFGLKNSRDRYGVEIESREEEVG